ncbi:MAG: 50S ribosomal protein L3 N(5)-glutamine methyltransferase [Betaproteobacteria bacterium]|nr:50S ribosomal protein L3 N(5)-glutamine methyltransferase [Betaproteobacteria bacterium]
MIPAELVTLRDVLRWTVSRFGEEGLSFGHGTQSAYDEAVYLLLHTLRLPLDRLEPFLDARLTSAELETLGTLLARRIDERIPAAYLTHEAWLGDYRFYVDERVIVPRSHIAELLLDGTLEPWFGDPASVGDALDLCTGSGCLAVLLGLTFPVARIDAADLSADALAVAVRNVADYGLDDRIRLLRSDVFAGLGERQYDLIISNPPYVTGEAMRALPAEYRHEPEMALAAGEDGLDIVRRILAGAAGHLKSKGILAVEVGGNREIVERAFPRLAFSWIESAGSEGDVFVLLRDQLT